MTSAAKKVTMQRRPQDASNAVRSLWKLPKRQQAAIQATHVAERDIMPSQETSDTTTCRDDFQKKARTPGDSRFSRKAVEASELAHVL